MQFPEIEPIRYLAVSPLPTQEYKLAIGIKRPSPSCIQIWSLRTPQEDSPGDRDNPLNLRCSLILCTEYGPAIQLKWCPLPCNDDEAVSSEKPRKLGILAGTFADGSLSIFAVPDPRKLASSASPLAGNENAVQPLSACSSDCSSRAPAYCTTSAGRSVVLVLRLGKQRYDCRWLQQWYLSAVFPSRTNSFQVQFLSPN